MWAHRQSEAVVAMGMRDEYAVDLSWLEHAPLQLNLCAFACNRVCATGCVQQGVCNRECATGSVQQGVCNRECATGSVPSPATGSGGVAVG